MVWWKGRTDMRVRLDRITLLEYADFDEIQKLRVDYEVIY